jgi:hypothetical protein
MFYDEYCQQAYNNGFLARINTGKHAPIYPQTAFHLHAHAGYKY